MLRRCTTRLSIFSPVPREWDAVATRRRRAIGYGVKRSPLSDAQSIAQIDDVSVIDTSGFAWIGTSQVALPQAIIARGRRACSDAPSPPTSAPAGASGARELPGGRASAAPPTPPSGSRSTSRRTKQFPARSVASSVVKQPLITESRPFPRRSSSTKAASSSANSSTPAAAEERNSKPC